MWHARLDMAQAEFVRMQSLHTDGVISQQQFEATESGLKSAQAQQRASQQRLAQAVLAGVQANRQTLVRATVATRD